MTALLGALGDRGFREPGQDCGNASRGGATQSRCARASPPNRGWTPGNLGGILGGASIGEVVSGGLRELMDAFKQQGHGEAAELLGCVRAKQADCASAIGAGDRTRRAAGPVATNRPVARRDFVPALQEFARGRRQVHAPGPHPERSGFFVGPAAPRRGASGELERGASRGHHLDHHHRLRRGHDRKILIAGPTSRRASSSPPSSESWAPSSRPISVRRSAGTGRRRRGPVGAVVGAIIVLVIWGLRRTKSRHGLVHRPASAWRRRSRALASGLLMQNAAERSKAVATTESPSLIVSDLAPSS